MVTRMKIVVYCLMFIDLKKRQTSCSFMIVLWTHTLSDFCDQCHYNCVY